MNIDMKVLVQLDDAFEYARLFLYSLWGDLKLVELVQLICLPVIFVVFAKGIYNVFVMQDLFFKLGFIEITVCLEILHAPVQNVDLLRL